FGIALHGVFGIMALAYLSVVNAGASVSDLSTIWSVAVLLLLGVDIVVTDRFRYAMASYERNYDLAIRGTNK
ncbi:MAG: hypothetical protein ACLFTZ_06340, partial [Acholeplasmataceae bacterium]